MKKAVLCALCVFTLAGCAERASGAADHIPEIVVTTAALCTTDSVETTAPETTEPVTTYEYYEYSEALPTFPVPDGADSSEVMAHYSFEVDENGVWVYYDDEKAQFLSVDTAELLTYDGDPIKLFYRDDYDFDGWNDLFIPDMIFRPNVPGHFFRFNIKTGLFDIWTELDEMRLYLCPDAEKHTLTRSESMSAVDHEVTVYRWQDEQLSPILREKQYHGNDEYIYNDYYRCYSGSDVLYRRERLLFDEDGKWLGTEKVQLD